MVIATEGPAAVANSPRKSHAAPKDDGLTTKSKRDSPKKTAGKGQQSTKAMSKGGPKKPENGEATPQASHANGSVAESRSSDGGAPAKMDELPGLENSQTGASGDQQRSASPAGNSVRKSTEAKRPSGRQGSPATRATIPKKQRSPSKPVVKHLVAPQARTAHDVRQDNDAVEEEIQLPPSQQQQQHHKFVNGNALHLLKLAKASHISADNPLKAIDYASRAATLLERGDGEVACLELVLCLHIVAAGYCRLKRYEEAVEVLKSSLLIPRLEQGSEHALALFAGHMQMGDTLSLMGKYEKALTSYHAALEIQKQVLGDMDPRVADTCRYLAEAHLQVMQLDEAQGLCEYVLNIHSKHSSAGSVDEAVDRKLLALVHSAKGEYEAALEHLVLASTALSCNGQEMDVASVDCYIGEAYFALGRYDEAVFSYQKALTVLKSLKGESHTSVAAVYVSLAELYLKTGKHREAKTYCENALRILGKQNSGHAPDELSSSLVEVAGVFEAMGEREQALALLKRSLEIIEAVPGEHSSAAGVEAQIGVLLYIMNRCHEAYDAFNSAASKLKLGSDRDTAFLGMLYHQMGLASVELHNVRAAAEHLEESQRILGKALGPRHPDTLAVSSNLAGCYDALGRVDDSISLLEKVVEVREENLGTVHPDVVRDRERLLSLLKCVGRNRARKTSTLEELLLLPNVQTAVK